MSWTHPAFEALARWLGERTGLTFAASRRPGAELGIRRAMARAKVDDPARYLALVRSDGAALDDLIVELTVGETYFFREPAQFQFIRREVLPEVRRRRGREHVVRAWSVASASGEEAYSLAIVFEEEGLAGQSHILATDISRAAITKMRLATYGPWSLRGESAAAALPYLERKGDRYIIHETIRRNVSIEYLNLAVDVYPSFATGTWGMDLILCRNVLIYFDCETVQNVARRLFESLAEGGWLITASSDPPLAELAPFETVMTNQGIFYRRGPLPVDSARVGWDTGAMFATTPTTLAPVTAPDRPAERVEPVRPLPPRAGRAAEGRPDGSEDNGQPGDAGSVLVAARDDFARGDYSHVVERTRELVMDGDAAAMHVRALANLNVVEADRACAEATSRHPLSCELHYLHALLLLELGRHEEAAQAARRVVYIDRTLAIAHFTLGTILRRLGDDEGARRSYRNARNLCAGRPDDEVVPLSDGEPAGRLAEAAEVQITLLDDPRSVAR